MFLVRSPPFFSFFFFFAQQYCGVLTNSLHRCLRRYPHLLCPLLHLEDHQAYQVAHVARGRPVHRQGRARRRGRALAPAGPAQLGRARVVLDCVKKGVLLGKSRSGWLFEFVCWHVTAAVVSAPYTTSTHAVCIQFRRATLKYAIMHSCNRGYGYCNPRQCPAYS